MFRPAHVPLLVQSNHPPFHKGSWHTLLTVELGFEGAYLERWSWCPGHQPAHQCSLSVYLGRLKIVNITNECAVIWKCFTNAIVRKENDFKVAIEIAVGHGWSIVDAVEQTPVPLFDQNWGWLLRKEQNHYGFLYYRIIGAYVRCALDTGSRSERMVQGIYCNFPSISVQNKII